MDQRQRELLFYPRQRALIAAPFRLARHPYTQQLLCPFHSYEYVYHYTPPAATTHAPAHAPSSSPHTSPPLRNLTPCCCTAKREDREQEQPKFPRIQLDRKAPPVERATVTAPHEFLSAGKHSTELRREVGDGLKSRFLVGLVSRSRVRI